MKYSEYQFVGGTRILVQYEPTLRLKAEMLMWNLVYFLISVSLKFLGGKFVLIRVDELKYIKEREVFWIASLAKKRSSCGHSDALRIP